MERRGVESDLQSGDAEWGRSPLLSSGTPDPANERVGESGARPEGRKCEGCV